MTNKDKKYRVGKESKRNYGLFSLYPQFFETLKDAEKNAEMRSVMQNATYKVEVHNEDTNTLETVSIFANGQMIECVHGLRIKLIREENAEENAEDNYRIVVDDRLMQGHYMYFNCEYDAIKYAELWSNFWFIPRVVLIQELTGDEWLTIVTVDGENIF